MRGLKVTVSISHSFDSDLAIRLVSPGGKAVVLADGLGTWGNGFSNTAFADGARTSIVSGQPPFTGRFRPVEPLAALNGSRRGGTWTLKVIDRRARYSGRIDAWRLELSDCAGTKPRHRAGASPPPALPQGAPHGQEPVEGRLVTVTANTDVTNGDVSSIAALQANPGPDGLSLREAIEMTNNDPGRYTVRFDNALGGSTIDVTNELPVLRGGGVFIDGDIDGDGRPDVTLADPAHELGWAFNLASSGNRLHALSLHGFAQGVVFTAMKNAAAAALLKDQTFARNVVSGVVLRGIAVPISVQPTLWHEPCERSPCRTGSRWLDTRIVGNTIDSRRNGAIWVGWASDDGDAMRRVTVAGNRMQVGGRPVGTGIGEGTGIYLTVGTTGSRDNLISDALVAYNAIEIDDLGTGVQVLAGQQGRSGNVVEDVRIIGNRVRFPHPRPAATEAVSIFVSDGCWAPGRHCRNHVGRVEVLGNVLEGAYTGVRVAEPCCNTEPSTVSHVLIADNVVRSVISAPTEFQVPWGIAIGGTRPGTSDIEVDSNTVVQTTVTDRNYGAFLTAGGIAILGGVGKEDTSVKGVSVTYNRIATRLIGIVLLGGGPSREQSGQDDAIGNVVRHVKLRGNVVTRVPRLARHWDRRIKGISLIGGVAGPARPTAGWSAHENTVECVTASGNVVAGKRNSIAVLPNVGAGTYRNVARFGGC